MRRVFVLGNRLDSTSSSTMIRETIQRITEYFTTATNAVSNQIRVAITRWSSGYRSTHDWKRADYAYWRNAYYARVKGLEISGLFIKPLVNKVAAWTAGRSPHWKLENEAAQTALDTWWADAHPEILRGWQAALKQGDVYLIVNPDLSISLVKPDLVKPIVSDDDYSQIIGWRIEQVFSHPTRTADRMTVVDEYTPAGRVRTTTKNHGQELIETYPNLIGRLPIVHIPNNREDGETFGHPEAEALVEVLHRYGAVIQAAIEGNILQGRPTPWLNFETVEQLDKFWADYGSTESHTLPDGTTETSTVLSVDLNQLLTTAGALFDYKSPGNFANDAVRILEILFYLILEHTELPEFVFGNAIASSKASAETQMPVFIRFVEMKQAAMGGWLREIAEIALAYLSLTTPGVPAESPALQWESLADSDGRLTLDTVAWAYAEGLIDERTALMLAPVDIEDIDAVLEAAAAERETRFPENREPSDDVIARLFAGEIDRQEREA